VNKQKVNNGVLRHWVMLFNHRNQKEIGLSIVWRLIIFLFGKFTLNRTMYTQKPINLFYLQKDWLFCEKFLKI
jgi:hypothetical protein